VLPAIIGVDEKAIAKGHRYMTLVCDLQQATVEYIAEERKQASLQSYFDGFEPEALEAVRAVSLDMWPPYINACLQTIPGAERKIVFDRFHIMRHELKGAQLKTARAWALKESLRELWHFTREAWAERFWRRWHFWATHSQLPPIVEAAKTIARHLPNVLTYFKHRITNAAAEGLNSKIATIHKRACDYRNPERFKIAVYFHCGGLNLWPARYTH